VDGVVWVEVARLQQTSQELLVREVRGQVRSDDVLPVGADSGKDIVKVMFLLVKPQMKGAIIRKRRHDDIRALVDLNNM